MQQAIIWTNADPVHWRIYVELRKCELNKSHEISIFQRN